MKLKIILSPLLVAIVALVCVVPVRAEHLVLITSNDTHSQIDPDENNLGGVLRRKVVIDSVRAANPNVLLIDLGDIVQGTLYFNLFHGKIENRLMNELGYDIRILGNHEFDNGVKALADNWKDQRSVNLSTNYKITDPDLKPLIKPYLIKQYGKHKVGFIAINLRPKGMISKGNYDGVEYMDAFTAANATAWHLKYNEGVDMVIALTHIGYSHKDDKPSDTLLALKSTDIDLILGAHTHDTINPANPDSKRHLVPTADSDSIIVTQAGKSGRYVGLVDIDLESGKSDYKLIRIDSRLDSRCDMAMDTIIAPYRAKVQAKMKKKITKSAAALSSDSEALRNFVADFIRDLGRQIAPKVDFAIVNKGGIRRGLPKGSVSEGQLIEMLPFNNWLTIIDIKGSDLMQNFDIMAQDGGNCVSSEMDITFDPATDKTVSALLNGQPIDPDRTYRVATINYLSDGGDYMTPLTKGTLVARSKGYIFDEIIEIFKTGQYRKKTINPAGNRRMHPVQATK